MLKGKRFPLKMKGKVSQKLCKITILYGSEAWCLREQGMAILRTESAMIRAMCGVKLQIEETTS